MAWRQGAPAGSRLSSNRCGIHSRDRNSGRHVMATCQCPPTANTPVTALFPFAAALRPRQRKTAFGLATDPRPTQSRVTTQAIRLHPRRRTVKKNSRMTAPMQNTPRGYKLGAPSPLERGGKLEGARRTEIELILITRIGPGRVDGVGYVAHAECQPNVLELRGPKVAAWNIHEGEDIADRVRLHPGEVVLEQEAASDMAHRAADLDRPARPIVREPI